MLKSIIGQTRTKKHLHQAALTDRLAHAYLLAGEEGLGAEELAIEFGRYLLCRQPDPASFEYCGSCPSCRKTAGFEHPDMHYYFPLLKSVEDEQIRSLLDQKSRSLYTNVKIAGGSIHIGDPENPGEFSIRGLIRDVSKRSFEGGRKIYIITYIEEMNAESANAFLKVLEEPPEKTFFILTTSQLPAILSTIVSRCQLLRLQPVEETDMIQALIQGHAVSPERARLITRLSNGNVHKSLQLLSGTLEERRSMMLDFLLAAVHPRSSAIITHVDGIVKTHKKEKEVFNDMLVLMMSWFQDILYYRNLSGSPEVLEKYMINGDILERIKKFYAKFPDTCVHRIVEEVEKAVDLISRNAYLNLVLTQLALRLRKETGSPLV